MILYKSSEEIEIMREGGKILAEILRKSVQYVSSGKSAKTLEDFAREEIKKAGATPAFLNYNTDFGIFPAALCISVNEEVVHGTPDIDKIFQDGDLVGIDCGVWYKGFCTDAAITVACGSISYEAQKLLNTAQEALAIGVSKCQTGNYISDISIAIQRYVESHGFCVIKSLVGHGVGRSVHEDPAVPNFFPFDDRNLKNKGPLIREGMTLAIEPMISVSSENTKRVKDCFAAITEDGSKSAHFEHTVAVTKKGPVILTY